MMKLLNMLDTQKILAIKGDATDSLLLENIGINKGEASTIIAITNNDAVNLSIILNCSIFKSKYSYHCSCKQY